MTPSDAQAAKGQAAAAPRALGAALRRLAGYVRRHLVYYGVWGTTTLGYVAGFVAVPLLVGWAVAAAQQGRGPSEVARRCALLLCVALARAVLRFFSRTLVFNAAREIEYELRNDLFAQLQRLPQSFYARWRTGDLMSRCVNDINSVRLLLGPGLLSVVQTPVIYVVVLSSMFALNAKLTLLVVLPYPAFLLIARVFGRTLHGRNLAVQRALAEISNHVQETVSGISVVKAYAMETAQEERFERVNQHLYRCHLRLVRAYAAMPAITSLLPAVAMWVVLLVGSREITSGRMQVSDFFTFAMYIYELTFPTFIMGWVVALVQRGAAAMQRLDEVLSTDPTIADRGDALPVEELRGDIEFRSLTLRYSEDREPALRDVSLRVPAGTVLGVVGPVGAGKSSLCSVVPRLFEVEDGQLFVDGIDVNRIPLRTLRAAIAMVPQEPFLFSITLAENLAYGLPAVDLSRIEEAAGRAHLDKDVAELPDGYQTVVGERGVMLSGGQRQRAALARALAVDPAILILDDTMSSVDAETEAQIRRSLREVFSGRTVLVVSHRVSAVRDADQIVVLDGGRIRERGTHRELVRAGGLYARLVQDQALEGDVEAGEAVA